jgi:hypothetical protein
MNRLSLLLLLFLSSLIFCPSAFAQSRQSASIELEHFAPAIDTVRDPGRHFIMPTAQANQGGYIGAWELAFLQAGFGVDDVLSVNAGITAMPTVAFRSQFAFVNAKITVADEPMFSFALGGNFLRLTSDLPYFHLFAVGTYEHEDKTRISGTVFYKVSGEDFPVVNVVPYGSFAFTYGGSMGAGAGFDTPFLDISNMRIVGELWNHDLQSPSKLMAILALRVESSRFSSDFGFAYFTMPLLAPVANFVWRF